MDAARKEKSKMANIMEDNIEYNEEKMLKFIQIDLLLKRVYHDLGADNSALEVVFSSYVYGDTVMENIYRTL